MVVDDWSVSVMVLKTQCLQPRSILWSLGPLLQIPTEHLKCFRFPELIIFPDSPLPKPWGPAVSHTETSFCFNEINNIDLHSVAENRNHHFLISPLPWLSHLVKDKFLSNVSSKCGSDLCTPPYQPLNRSKPNHQMIDLSMSQLIVQHL